MESDYRDFIISNPETRLSSLEEYSVIYDRIKKKIINKDYSIDTQKDLALKQREIEKVRKERQEEITKQLKDIAAVDYKTAYQI